MTAPLRPAFSEGQVLAAADLAATVEHARAAAARHARALHDWGIADGLGLRTESRTDPATGARFVEVSAAAGLAVDGTGREIVVPAPVVLSEAEFTEVNGADQPTAEPYPVFLIAVDRPQTGTGAVSCGSASAPTRVAESFQIRFGRLGDERLVEEQQPSPVGAPPAEPPVVWWVLLGYVRWTDGHFTAVASTARGVSVRYAGVRADTVAARSGTLSLRTRTAVQEGQPALVLSGEDPPSLVYGLYQGSGAISPLMTVAANGNLTIAGSFSGRISAGSVLVASGTATDGTLLPLPAGVAPQEVADGRVALHVYLTPRVPPSPTGLWSPIEATVDGERRVRCRIRSYDPIAAPGEVVDESGAVDYLVLATVAAAGGAQ
ncbi:hypothetical protein V5P93_003479 [Actinokineospora auranticolor]|uniref:Uncharacterized protein n=1 Tax=Actinokineospora auranticolor TaxID=155976 RepID=A0A2S6GPG3_9PSEU|nr:hypothetical protein [Actinokineospora auranticolor]PPK67142.1 hypothetical protein CLV40_108139 [Actinokineospora auranticolor]